MSQAPPILIYQPGGGVSSPIGSNPPVYSQAGTTVLVEDQDYIDVVFGSSQTADDWVLVECIVVNELDDEPLNIWPGIITDKTAAGFRLQLNGMPDSGNYYLHWAVSGVNITPTAATTYALSGPASGAIGEEATFTVSLLPNTTLGLSVVVTPSEGGLEGGVFSPETVTLSAAVRSVTFTYTPAVYAETTISVNNDGGLINPADVTFTSVADTYELSGPSNGTTGVASTDFTVELPAGGIVIGTVTVTPGDGGDGGTFTPTSVELTTASPSATFTYTPASTGDKTISGTNDGGLTNPGNLIYTSDPAVSVVMKDLFTDTNGTVLTSHTMDIGAGWTKYEGTGGTDITILSNAALCPLDAGSAYGYITESGVADGLIEADAAFGTATNAYFSFIVFRYTDTSNFWRVAIGGGGAGNIVLDKTVAGVTTALDTDALVITASGLVLVAITLSGTSVTVSVEDQATATTVNLNATDAFNQTATKVGLRMYRSAVGAVVLHDIQVTG